MPINKNELKVEYMRGKGPGGQHKNKTDSACRITHIPTGLRSYADERSQKHSYRKALEDLEKKIQSLKDEKKALAKKEKRDKAIKENERIRTYDYSRGIVTDHRTGKTASIKNVVEKGKIDLLK